MFPHRHTHTSSLHPHRWFSCKLMVCSQTCRPVLQVPVNAIYGKFGSVDICGSVQGDSICHFLKQNDLRNQTSVLIFGSVLTMICFWHFLVAIRESYHSACRREQARMIEAALDYAKQQRL